MDYRAILEVGAAGMAVERKRLEVATLNLANMHHSVAPGTTGYQPLRVVAKAASQDFASLMQQPYAPYSANSAGPVQLALVPTNTSVRLVRDPGHPHADDKGMVSYPAVDQALEMVTAMAAMRAYEANIAALGIARTMTSRALEIGSQR